MAELFHDGWASLLEIARAEHPTDQAACERRADELVRACQIGELPHIGNPKGWTFPAGRVAENEVLTEEELERRLCEHNPYPTTERYVSHLSLKQACPDGPLIFHFSPWACLVRQTDYYAWRGQGESTPAAPDTWREQDESTPAAPDSSDRSAIRPRPKPDSKAAAEGRRRKRKRQDDKLKRLLEQIVSAGRQNNQPWAEGLGNWRLPFQAEAITYAYGCLYKSDPKDSLPKSRRLKERIQALGYGPANSRKADLEQQKQELTKLLKQKKPTP